MNATALRKQLRRPFVTPVYGYTRGWVVVASGAIVVAALLGGILLFAAVMSSRTCYAKAARMDVPAYWGVWTDCMVQVDGRVPLDNVRIIPAQS